MEKGKGALARRGLASSPLAEAGPARPRSTPSPRPRQSRVHTCGRPRRDALARRLRSAAAWRACGDLDAPWSATRCARLRSPSPLLPDALVHLRSRSLSRPRAAAAAPPLAIAAGARSSSPSQLRPPPSHLRRPATPPHPSAPCARAQSRSVSLARPVELTGVSRSSDGLLARVILPLLSAIACVLECISFGLASRIISRR